MGLNPESRHAVLNMPVSLVSYFPTLRNTDRIVGLNAGVNQIGNRVFLACASAGANSTISDIVVIGNGALSAGVLDDANHIYSGAVVLGSQAAVNAGQLLYGWSAPTIIGGWAANAAVSLESNVVIGTNAARNLPQIGASVIIGTDAVRGANGGGGVGMPRNVLIGIGVGMDLTSLSAMNTGSIADSVVLGFNAYKYLYANAGEASGNVLIGSNACNNTSATLNGVVAIGNQVTESLGAGSKYLVVLGSGQTLAGTATIVDTVALGYGIQYQGAARSTLIGSQIQAPATNGNVILGAFAGVNDTSAGDIFIVESNTDAAGSNHKAILYGNLSNGNLIIGKSTIGTNRDFGGGTSTNILKLLNGTIGNANPVGGGYFYVNAGALHWVGSSGTDTPLAVA